MILVSRHSKATVYHCPRCGYKFEISMLTDFFGPHGVDREGSWKYLRCPNCSNRSRMKILVKTKDTEDPHNDPTTPSQRDSGS